jgi:hypothetical protein
MDAVDLEIFSASLKGVELTKVQALELLRAKCPEQLTF